uniref:Putative gland protein G17G06 n=1 Tax=Heterodera glycines TaxID=51029 RepID=Q86M76_HETGL|nr:putative gland protein G17G06 [Heterodera glycines]
MLSRCCWLRSCLPGLGKCSDQGVGSGRKCRSRPEILQTDRAKEGSVQKARHDGEQHPENPRPRRSNGGPFRDGMGQNNLPNDGTFGENPNFHQSPAIVPR